jgi:hypothetical protein
LKRLYLVGTTADSKRLVLAKSQGAKFGSFSVPITAKLKKLVREQDEGRVENLSGTGRGSRPAAEAAAETDAPRTTQVTAAAPRAGTSFENMTGLSRRGGSAAREQANGRGKAAAKAASAPKGKAAAPPPAPAPDPEPEPPKPAERRPAINSKLAPAQIQALLRQGRTARSVAKEAGAPIEWVQRLMEPILLERMGIVEEMKRATYTKARKGRSIVPVGSSIVDGLRERGVPFPERTANTGWTAYRPEGREWRVKFTYEHRGGSRTAQWHYDPPSRSVVPTNLLATQLSWRPDPSTVTDNHEGGHDRPRRAPARKAAPKRTPAKRGAKKPAARKKTSARKPAAKAKKSAAKRSAARR